MSIVHTADGWLLLVSWLMNGVLFMLVFRLVAVGWQLWIALMVGVVLFKMELIVGLVLVVMGGVLFILLYIVGIVG